MKIQPSSFFWRHCEALFRDRRVGHGPYSLLMFALVACLLGTGRVRAADPATNLDLIRKLAASAADTLATILPAGQRTAVVVLPAGQAWLIDAAVYGSLAGAMASKDSADLLTEFALRSVSIAYAGIESGAFLGGRTIGRSVTAEFSATMLRRATGLPVFSGDLVRTWEDRIPLARIDAVENEAVPMTRGVRESEGFFSNVAEPLIFLAAIGIAVFLLFHVRS